MVILTPFGPFRIIDETGNLVTPTLIVPPEDYDALMIGNGHLLADLTRGGRIVRLVGIQQAAQTTVGRIVDVIQKLRPDAAPYIFTDCAVLSGGGLHEEPKAEYISRASVIGEIVVPLDTLRDSARSIRKLMRIYQGLDPQFPEFKTNTPRDVVPWYVLQKEGVEVVPDAPTCPSAVRIHDTGYWIGETLDLRVWLPKGSTEKSKAGFFRAVPGVYSVPEGSGVDPQSVFALQTA